VAAPSFALFELFADPTRGRAQVRMMAEELQNQNPLEAELQNQNSRRESWLQPIASTFTPPLLDCASLMAPHQELRNWIFVRLQLIPL